MPSGLGLEPRICPSGPDSGVVFAELGAMPGTAETLKVDDVAGRRVSLCNDMRRLFSGDDAGCDVAPAGVLDEDVMGGSNGPSVPMGRARFLA